MQQKEWLYVIAFFSIGILILTFPAILNIHTQIIGDGGDSLQFLGYQYIAKQEFMDGNFPFGWTNYWRYPYGVEIPNIVDSSLFVIVGLLLYQIFSDVIVVYNLSALVLLVCNAVGSYYAFRTKYDILPSIIGAVMYGVSFYSIARLGGHVSLMVIAGFPLLVFSTLRLYETKGSLASFLLATASTLIIAFATPQYPLLFLGVLPFTLLIFVPLFPEQTKEFFLILWHKKWYVLLSLGLLLGVFSLFHGQKLIDLIHGEVPMPVYTISSVPFINFITPNDYLNTVVSILPNNSRPWIEYVTFPGYIELLLFFGAIILVKKDHLTYFLLGAAGVSYIIALGVQDILEPLWPYQHLFPFFPFRGIIEPGRFVIITYLWLTILVMRWLQTIYHKQRLLVILILVLLCIERLPIGFQMSPDLYTEGFISSVKKTPTRAVLDMPVQTDWWNGQIYDLYSVYYEKPIVNGYFNWSGNTPEAKTLVTFLEPYTCYPEAEYAPKDYDEGHARWLKDEVFRQLKFYRIQTIVLHKNLLYPDGRCQRAQQYIDVLLEDDWRFIDVYESEEKLVLLIKN